jgi:co-chaperonin GroES (HSP10)
MARFSFILLLCQLHLIRSSSAAYRGLPILLGSTSHFTIPSPTFRPFHDYILTQPNPSPPSSHGLHLPQQQTEALTIAKVIGVGPGSLSDQKFKPCETKVDEYVAYPSTECSKLKVNGICYDLLQEESILLKSKSFELEMDELSCLKDHLLVELLSASAVAAPSQSPEIIFPDSRKSKLSFAKVVKVSSEQKTEADESGKVEVAPGDRILFKNDGLGHQLRINGKSYQLLHAKDLLIAL